MLVVLVGLDGDAGQGGIAVDVVGLPQIAVAGGEAAREDSLSRSIWQQVVVRVRKVQVVDVDVPARCALACAGLRTYIS